MRPIYFLVLPLAMLTASCHSQSHETQPSSFTEPHEMTATTTPTTNSDIHNISDAIPADDHQKGEIQVKSNDTFTLDEQGFQTDAFTTASGKNIAFHCIKHGSLRIQFNGIEFQIDPVSKLDGNDTDYSQFPKADYILVTHDHYDHLDTDAVSKLEKPETQIITNATCAQKLGRGLAMSNGDSKVLSQDIKIEAVSAYNTTPGRDKFHPKGRDNGFILTLDGFRIYIAADTEVIPEMSNIKDIDVAFMPCNQPYTMTPAQLAKAASIVAPKVLFPYHFSDTSKDAMKAAFKDSPIDVRIRNYQ